MENGNNIYEMEEDIEVEDKPKYSRSMSVDTAEYSRVADDINLIPEYFEEESHYSEIGRMTIRNKAEDKVQMEIDNDIRLNSILFTINMHT